MTPPGVVILQRCVFHLGNDRRIALDAGDVAQCGAIKAAIATLETLARSLRADEYLQRRKKRAEERQLREKNEANRLLQFKLAAVAGKFPTALPIAA